MPLRTGLSFFLPVAAGLFVAAPAAATVIPQAPDDCLIGDEVGEIEILADWISGDAGCSGKRSRLKMRSVAALWESDEVPMMIEVKRDRKGYRLIMLSMLLDRRSGHPCWSELPIPSSHRRSPAATWKWVEASFERWAPTCSTTAAVGVGKARKALRERRFDFERGFAGLAKVPAQRFGKPEEGTSVGSFQPKRVTQGLLDAVADACQGPRERLKLLPDGAIAWSPDKSLPFGDDGSRPFDSCVDLNIRYFPGYPKRN